MCSSDLPRLILVELPFSPKLHFARPRLNYFHVDVSNHTKPCIFSYSWCCPRPRLTGEQTADYPTSIPSSFLTHLKGAIRIKDDGDAMLIHADTYTAACRALFSYTPCISNQESFHYQSPEFLKIGSPDERVGKMNPDERAGKMEVCTFGSTVYSVRLVVTILNLSPLSS